LSQFIELEIQNLLNETSDLDEVSVRLIQTLESNSEEWTSNNITSLSQFLVNAGKFHLLIEFVLAHVEEENFAIPWAYFLEALGHSTLQLDEKTVKSLLEGIEESKAKSEASRALSMNEKLPQLGEWRSHRKYKIHREYRNNKDSLLDQLITLRTQQLYEQEKSLLIRLQKLYPGDDEILHEVREDRQRRALDILARHSPKTRPLQAEDFIPRDPEVEKVLEALLESLYEHAESEPEMAFDFAVAAFMLEAYPESLQILNFCEPTESYLWFRLEVLLKCRRFVELLAEITQVEVLLSHEPETFFATAYLRAQALWGLGNKHMAIEVMEGVLASRPHYRAGGALLSIWSTQ